MCIICMLISVMYHFPDQFSHLTVPDQRRLIFHAVFQIPLYMCEAFLMGIAILIKGDFVVVYQSTLEILCYSSLYTFIPLFLTGEVKNLLFIWCSTYIYICTLSVYPDICKVCMHNRRRNQVCKDLLLLCLCLT